MDDLVLRGAADVWGHGPGDVVVRGGEVVAIGPGAATGAGGRYDGPAGERVEVVDCTGRVVLPALVEGHAHLDKTLLGGPWVPHSAGDALADRIGNERRRRGPLGLPDVDHVTTLLERMVVAGTGHVRSHTDVDPEVGLRGVEAVAEAARGGSKPSGYKDTGVTLITDDPVDGVESKDSKYGLENCWG
ncbi:MAG TPA: hypothetical protein VKA65_16715 [Acidimicrobiales bacterium]|nr:hypothetical protein [Acidimicrobiales bacterium]